MRVFNMFNEFILEVYDAQSVRNSYYFEYVYRCWMHDPVVSDRNGRYTGGSRSARDGNNTRPCVHNCSSGPSTRNQISRRKSL